MGLIMRFTAPKIGHTILIGLDLKKGSCKSLVNRNKQTYNKFKITMTKSYKYFFLTTDL